MTKIDNQKKGHSNEENRTIAPVQLDKTIVKRRLFELLNNRKLEAISKKTGVPPATLSPIIQRAKDPNTGEDYLNEDGEIALADNDRLPHLDTLYAIAANYGVSLDWLCGLTDARTPDAKVQAVHKYTGLSDDAIKRICNIEKPIMATAENPNAGMVDVKNARSLESYCRETTHFANFNFGLLRVLDDFLASGDLSTFMGHLSAYFYSYDDDTALMDAVKELMKMKVEIAERYGVFDLINIYRGDPTVNLKSAFKKLRVALDKKAVTEKEKASVRLMLEKTQKALEPLVLEYDFKLALEEANLMEYFGFPDASIERHYDGPKPKYIGKKKKAVAAGGDG